MITGMLQILCYLVKGLLCFDFILSNSVFTLYLPLHVAFNFANFGFQFFLVAAGSYQLLVQPVNLPVKLFELLFFRKDADSIVFASTDHNPLTGDNIAVFGNNGLQQVIVVICCYGFFNIRSNNYMP